MIMHLLSPIQSGNVLSIRAKCPQPRVVTSAHKKLFTGRLSLQFHLLEHSLQSRTPILGAALARFVDPELEVLAGNVPVCCSVFFVLVCRSLKTLVKLCDYSQLNASLAPCCVMSEEKVFCVSCLLSVAPLHPK